MAYTNNPRMNPRDAVRLLVGDVSTSTSAEFLSDVDYDFFISETPNRYSAAVLVCNSLAALNGGKGITKSVGDLSYTKGDATYYMTLAAQFRVMSALQGSGAPYAGGISINDKRSNELNIDRPRPNFYREVFDDPSAKDPAVNTQETTT